MADAPMKADFLARFGETHAAGLDMKWWTLALERIAARSAEQSPRYDAFRAFIGRFLLPVDAGPIGFDLRDLSDAKKWLLLVAVDEFLDQEIVWHDTDEQWGSVWEQATRLYEAGFDHLVAHPDVLCGKLEGAWLKLRAAAS